MPDLLAELASRLRRPWIAGHLAADTHGPLYAWAHSCARLRADASPAAQQELFTVHLPHQVRPLSDLLPRRRPATDPAPPTPPPGLQTKPGGELGQGPWQEAGKQEAGKQEGGGGLRVHSRRAEESFAQGLAHARSYHAQHGHLAVPTHHKAGDYPLGRWLANTRARRIRMPDHQAAALTALCPWWNAPWSSLWQRTWHQARTHRDAHGPLQPAGGFPTTSVSLSEWLYLQCTRYTDLHPAQHHLMAEIGIDAAAAAVAAPRARNRKAGSEEALAHARSYATLHGHLAGVTDTTVHEGFRLGPWLAGQRDTSRPVPAERAKALADIDPWWCPPWDLRWQRAYYRAKDATPDRRLQLAAGFSNLDPAVARWLQRQCHALDDLQPAQLQLLAEIGLTADVARTAVARAHHAAAHRARPGAPCRPGDTSLTPPSLRNTYQHSPKMTPAQPKQPNLTNPPPN